MRTTGGIKTDILVQLGVSTSVAFYTDTILNDWIDKAHKWAAAYKKWPATEGRISTTYVEDSNEVGFGYPEGWKPDSIRMMQIGGKRLRKKNFYKYQEFREDYPTDTEKMFSDHGRLYFINPQADVSGTTTIWGQYTPADLDATDVNAETVFSTFSEEANEAVVQEVISYAKIKEKKTQEAFAYHERAKQILEETWKAIIDEQFNYQDTDNDGMFKRINVLEGAFSDEIIKRDQWY